MEKIKIIIDTDLGGDCDDTGALAVAYNLVKEGKAEVLAVTHCCSAIGGAVAVKAINDWYGMGDIPIGRCEDEAFARDKQAELYGNALMNEYLKNNDMPEFENAVRLLRKTLAGNDNVTLITIGMFNNIADLLRSGADDISELSGVELVNKSVDKLYSMGGHFEDLTYAEYNIKLDIAGAKYVAENFPKPIIYCGFEIGHNLLTGKNLENLPDCHPVKFSYVTYLNKVKIGGVLRDSWDPITVYCAVEQESEAFSLSEGYKIGFDDEGRVLLEKGGKDYYIKAEVSNEEIAQIIDALIP